MVTGPKSVDVRLVPDSGIWAVRVSGEGAGRPNTLPPSVVLIDIVRAVRSTVTSITAEPVDPKVVFRHVPVYFPANSAASATTLIDALAAAVGGAVGGSVGVKVAVGAAVGVGAAVAGTGDGV